MKRLFENHPKTQKQNVVGMTSEVPEVIAKPHLPRKYSLTARNSLGAGAGAGVGVVLKSLKEQFLNIASD